MIHIVKAALARCTGPQLRRWAPLEPEQVLAASRSACHRRLKQALLSRGPVVAVSGGPSAGHACGFLLAEICCRHCSFDNVYVSGRLSATASLHPITLD